MCQVNNWSLAFKRSKNKSTGHRSLFVHYWVAAVTMLSGSFRLLIYLKAWKNTQTHNLQANWVWWHLQELERAMQSGASTMSSTPLLAGTENRKSSYIINNEWKIKVFQCTQSEVRLPGAGLSVVWVWRSSIFQGVKGWREEAVVQRVGSGCCQPPVRLPLQWWVAVDVQTVSADWTWQKQVGPGGPPSGHYTPHSTLWKDDQQRKRLLLPLVKLNSDSTFTVTWNRFHT